MIDLLPPADLPDSVPRPGRVCDVTALDVLDGDTGRVEYAEPVRIELTEDSGFEELPDLAGVVVTLAIPARYLNEVREPFPKCRLYLDNGAELPGVLTEFGPASCPIVIEGDRVHIKDAPEAGHFLRLPVVQRSGRIVTLRFAETAAIRELRCWSPETRTKDAEEKAAGLAAKEYRTERFGPGTRLRMHTPDPVPGKHGDESSFERPLAHLYAHDGTLVGEAMVSAGHATRTREG